jgi:hypothetical protein
MVIETEIRDAIARGDSVTRKGRGQALAAFAELRVGELAIAGDDADFCAEQVDCTVEASERSERNEHFL